MGLLCGLVAVAFHFAIHHLFEAVWHFAEGKSPLHFILTLLLAPTLGGLVVGLMVSKYAPEAGGSGIPQTKAAYYNKGGKISIKTGIFRFILGSLYVGLGNSLGREGPTVHICTSISSRIGRSFFIDPVRIQSMAPVGMAAGIAAAFNAPLSALTFVFEELLENFSMKALGGMVVAVVVAAAVSRTILGEDPVLITSITEDYTTSWWMLVAIPIGAFAGIIGHSFVWSILNLRIWFNEKSKLPAWIRPASGGLSCGILALLAYYLTDLFGDARNSVFSIGYDSLEAAFRNSLTIEILVILLVLKFIAVVINYASGGSGGIFSPTLFIGGILGAIMGIGFINAQQMFVGVAEPMGDEVVGACVLLGMGAMFAAVVRCPFTSLIIIFEMTGNYSLILPLMGGNMLAWTLAKWKQPQSIYTSLLLQDKITLKRMPTYRGAQDYRKLPVKAIMCHGAYKIRENETLGACLLRIKEDNKQYHAYPVVDVEGELVGVITYHEIREFSTEKTVAEIIKEQKLLFIKDTTSIREAAALMVDRDFQQVPVVSEADTKHLLGWLTMNDIMRQQNAMEE
ncbi:chloride channel protein [Akkermansiaceae bacterium]|nr:chloride channel protein [Akkermansiaceae bacterium]